MKIPRDPATAFRTALHSETMVRGPETPTRAPNPQKSQFTTLRSCGSSPSHLPSPCLSDHLSPYSRWESLRILSSTLFSWRWLCRPSSRTSVASESPSTSPTMSSRSLVFHAQTHLFHFRPFNNEFHNSVRIYLLCYPVRPSSCQFFDAQSCRPNFTLALPPPVVH